MKMHAKVRLVKMHDKVTQAKMHTKVTQANWHTKVTLVKLHAKVTQAKMHGDGDLVNDPDPEAHPHILLPDLVTSLALRLLQDNSHIARLVILTCF